jgi:hypothetical protein
MNQIRIENSSTGKKEHDQKLFEEFGRKNGNKQLFFEWAKMPLREF